MICILFICHGNICRSTMAESFFTYIAAAQGLSGYFEVDSAATSREEIGNPPHRGTIRKLRERGIPLIPHSARRITISDAMRFDLLIGMDDENIRNIKRICGTAGEGKIHKLLEFAGYGEEEKSNPRSYYLKKAGHVPDVADPWYTGDFEETYKDVSAGCTGLLEYCIHYFDL